MIPKEILEKMLRMQKIYEMSMMVLQQLSKMATEL